MQTHLLTIKDFCTEYKLSRSHVYGLLKSGNLRAMKIGRLTRISRAEADAWAAKLAPYKSAAA